MNRLVYILLTALFATACIRDVGLVNHFEERLVVDGRIEAGHNAVVMLSLNSEFSEEYSEEELRDMVVRWAKVTLCCEGEEEVLIGRSDENFPTQYIYRSTHIIGEVGKSYTLTVDYSSQRWSAQSHIPAPLQLTDIRVESVDGLHYSITAILPPSDTPCSIDCSLDGSSYFAPTILGVYDASAESRRITINPPIEGFGYSTLFDGEDVVVLRLNTLTPFGYEYWSCWENNVVNNFNPVFPAHDNLPTNLTNNAFGIWSGYGSSYHLVGKLSEAVHN